RGGRRGGGEPQGGGGGGGGRGGGGGGLEARRPGVVVGAGGGGGGGGAADRGRRKAPPADHPGDLSRPGAGRADPPPLAVRVPQGAGSRPPVHRDAAGELADEPDPLHLPGRTDLHARVPERDAPDRLPAPAPGQ